MLYDVSVRRGDDERCVAGERAADLSAPSRDWPEHVDEARRDERGGRAASLERRRGEGETERKMEVCSDGSVCQVLVRCCVCLVVDW